MWLPKRYSFLALLISLMGLILFLPFTLRFAWGGLLLEVLLSLILILPIYVLSNEKKYWIPAAALALPSIAFSWVQQFTGDYPMMSIIGSGLSALFMVYVVLLLLKHIFSQKTVSIDAVYGGMCCYLLIGICWALIYTMMEWALPGSFSGIQEETTVGLGSERLAQHFESFVYYSFVTLSTLGYGDVTPLSGEARAFAITEALIGQFYVAVLLGRLIGMHLRGSSSRV